MAVAGVVKALVEARGARRFLVGLLVALALSAYTASYSAYMASDTSLGTLSYISDETWYVSASRTIAYKVFNLTLDYTDEEGFTYATLVYANKYLASLRKDQVGACLDRVGGLVVKEYSKAPLLWVKIPVERRESLRDCAVGAERVVWGYAYPDEERIQDYLNLEHPPLGKLAILASMLALGDKPLSWRVPSVVSAAALVVVVYLIGWRIAGLVGGVASSVLAFVEPVLRNMGFIAMLDTQLALWTGLALLAEVYGLSLASSVFAGLALATKPPGLFVVVAVSLMRVRNPKGVVAGLLVSLTVYLLANAPLVKYLGVEEWFNEQISAVKWHIQSRPSGPPTSPPWGWLVNQNPFPFHLNPDIYARVNTAAYMMALAASIGLVDKLLRREYAPLLFFTTIILGFTLVYLVGNRTLYSFYAIQLAPGVHASASVLVHEAYQYFLGRPAATRGSNTQTGGGAQT